VTLTIASIGRPSASGDGPFERLEDAAALQSRQSRLHGVAGQAEPLGERDDGGAVIVGERVQQVEVDAIKRSHTAQLYQEMSVPMGNMLSASEDA
jgi:hypothetical protein